MALEGPQTKKDRNKNKKAIKDVLGRQVGKFEYEIHILYYMNFKCPRYKSCIVVMQKKTSLFLGDTC